MFHYLLIIYAFLCAVFQKSYAESAAESSLEKFQSQAAQSMKTSAGVSQAQMAVSLIAPKFYPDKDGNPAVWKLISDPNAPGKPRISASEFVADQGVTNWVAGWGGKTYVVDKSGLAVLRKPGDLTDPNQEQDGFVAVTSLTGLSSTQAANYFGNETSRFPASQNAFQKTPIKFKSISTGTDGLRYLNVQVGSMNVDIPVPLSGGWYQEAYIKAPNGEKGVLYGDSTGDYFGRSTGLSGDTLIVGAHWEDSNQTTITNGTTASSDNSKVDSGAIYDSCSRVRAVNGQWRLT